MENNQEDIQNPEEKVAENVLPESSPNSLQDLLKVAEMRHKTFSQLLEISLRNYGHEILKSNKNSFQRKYQVLNSLIRAVMASLDYGLNITGKVILTEGTLKKEEQKLTELLIQAFDNRLLLVANKLDQGDTNERKED